MSAIENAVRDAYQKLSVKIQDWVPLRTLRPLLPGSRDEQDAVLRGLLRTGQIHLAPDSNRKVLTDADHAAAIHIGGEDKHLMAIDAD
ncbi:hypothetical protein [Actinosynnema mirum]|uniref:hypothetical protein n=1 Tax=Actinosynnema mirum TaxID=40567 RepID=UPI00019AB57C|nr:hypothetical protein [Actinosynnema mirum]